MEGVDAPMLGTEVSDLMQTANSFRYASEALSRRAAVLATSKPPLPSQSETDSVVARAFEKMARARREIQRSWEKR